MDHTTNPKSIKSYVRRFLHDQKDELKDKTILDFPAGNGFTSEILLKLGAHPLPYDLFPEYFKVETLICQKADIQEGIPMMDEYVDGVICQEGIEHFSDQYKSFKELNRVIKKDGFLLITTPNYSSLRAKLSYLLSESERFISLMPPNEADSIWMNPTNDTRIYFGHIFLLGIQKLRTLAVLNGFEIKKVHRTKIKTTSLFLFPLIYPFVLLFNSFTYWNSLRKNGADASRRKIYRQQFMLSIDPKILVTSHLMVEFTKTSNANEFIREFPGKHKSFNAAT